MTFLNTLVEGGLQGLSVMGTMHEVGYWEGAINESTPCKPQSQYGIAKNALRQSLMLSLADSPCRLHWLRAYYITGDEAHGSSIFAKITQAEQDGKATFPFTSGRNLYDFIDVDELANMIVAASVHKGDPAGKIDLESLCRAMGIRRVTVVDPYDLDACDRAVKEELAATEPSVIISRRPCALLKYVKHKPALVVDQDKCVGCRACMKLGCPAISIRGKKAMIDATQCVGCGVCSKLCRPGALGEVTK